MGLLLLVLFTLVVRGSFANPPAQVFTKTGYTVREPFLSFWQQGGVARFGYPISPEFPEQNPDDGQVYTVQYFERVRMEYHPGTAMPVQLGRLAAQHLEQLAGETDGPLLPAAGAQAAHLLPSADSTCYTFVETDQALCGPFAAYWQAGGGLPMFGYPLTPPLVHRTANDQTLMVQYTERARFELDPASKQVTLGLLGRELYVPQPETEPQIRNNERIAAQLLALINRERAVVGLPALTPAPELMISAQGHSQDMAKTGVISHTSADGRTAPQRMQAAGYAWSRCGENIAVGFSTAAAAMQFWMNSPPHRGNILDPGMREVGVGYVQQSGGHGHYWTTNFGER
jgi:uncharacterized protein YkwD